MRNQDPSNNRQLLAQVATLYWERGLLQREIADLLHVSRSTISRMLEEAKRCGIVEVRVCAPSFGAKIDWRQVVEKAPKEGVTLHVSMVTHPFSDSLLPLIPSFEELTGIKVLYAVLPQEEYWRKLSSDLSSGAGLIDVFAIGPEQNWPYIASGRAEPLDPYINDPRLTDLVWYDLEDFYSEALRANRWDGKTSGHGAHGSGPIYAIPVTYEVMSLAYQADLLREEGIEVDEGWPHSWQDIVDAANKLTKDKNGDGKIDQYGIITRGSREWTAMFGGYANLFRSWGAMDLDDDMNPAVNSPQGIAATELWVDLIRRCAPPETPSMEWYQVKQAFASGVAAMLIDCDWFAAAEFERPGSQVAGKLRYALTPPGPNGLRVEDVWFWSLGMNAASYHKTAAWLFIQWATSMPIMLRSTLEYRNWNPPRKSVWSDPRVVAMTSKWANYRQVVEENRRYARIPYAVNPHCAVLSDVWWANVRDALLGQTTVKEALDRSARQMREIIARAGLQRG